MPSVSQYRITERYRQVGGGTVTYASRYDTTRQNWTPSSNPSGGYITWPDGSRFRKATNWSKSVVWIQPGSSEDTKTVRLYNGKTGFERTSAGGYFADVQLSGNMCYIIGAPIIANLNNPPSINSSMRNECETKALLELADAKANIGENLATLSQILRLVKDPLSTLVKEFQKVRRDKNLWGLIYKSARDLNQGKALNGPAKEYLKYVYGWKPLVSDIYGIIELAKDANKRPLLINARGVSKREQFLDEVAFQSGSDRIRTTTSDATAISKSVCSLWATPDPNWAGSRTLNQLGLLNPASLAWELVPASFVIDWALPIGPVLQALTATAGLSFVDGSTSQRVSARWRYEQGHYAQPGYAITSYSPSKGIGAYEGYVREKLSGWPRPGFWWDPDPLRLKNDDSDRIFKFLALSLLQLK